MKGWIGGGFENRTGELHKFPFAGHDRFWFPHFFNRILGEAYKFCRCLKGKVEGEGSLTSEGTVLRAVFLSFEIIVLVLFKTIL